MDLDLIKTTSTPKAGIANVGTDYGFDPEAAEASILESRFQDRSLHVGQNRSQKSELRTAWQKLYGHKVYGDPIYEELSALKNTKESTINQGNRLPVVDQSQIRETPQGQSSNYDVTPGRQHPTNYPTHQNQKHAQHFYNSGSPGTNHRNQSETNHRLLNRFQNQNSNNQYLQNITAANRSPVHLHSKQFSDNSPQISKTVSDLLHHHRNKQSVGQSTLQHEDIDSVLHSLASVNPENRQIPGRNFTRNPSLVSPPSPNISLSTLQISPTTRKPAPTSVDPEHSGQRQQHNLNQREATKEYFDIRQLQNTELSRSLGIEGVSDSQEDDLYDSDRDSLLSFDVENTTLAVEPSDQSEMGTIKSGSSLAYRQRKRREKTYKNTLNTLDEQENRRDGMRTTRRWSIGSLDSSSIRQNHRSHSRHSEANTHSRRNQKDIRSLTKRFQKLESHLITLARSVAHLSSELHSQNTLSLELENIKRTVKDLNPRTPNLDKRSTHVESYQKMTPSLTNPKRVNKLTKFFGEAPPLLEIFLKRLGYERYTKNFEDEQIGMIELPYMTEDKLQAIGIPLGPRMRILHETKVCFNHENIDIYIV